MQDIIAIVACIGLGMLFGRLGRKKAVLLRVADKCALCAVYGLLFVLGARLGSDSALLARLPLLGGRAFCIALFCTVGSVFCLYFARGLFSFGPPGNIKPERFSETRAAAPGQAARRRKEPGAGASPVAGSLRILGCFFMGMTLAFFSLVPAWISGSALASYALYALVFAVGIGLGADLRAFRVVRDLHLKILAVPLLIVFGSALGALAAAAVLPDISGREALCVGMGLGYYSLSSILIENAGQPALASVALLANILREIMAIFCAPLLAGRFGPLALLGAAGATAMDTTLPIIARFSGERYAIIAVFSGMTLTLLVPFLVSALLHW